MIERRSGHIVHISSGVCRPGIRRFSALIYVPTKYAVEGLSYGLSVHLAPHNVRVNTSPTQYRRHAFLRGHRPLDPQGHARLEARPERCAAPPPACRVGQDRTGAGRRELAREPRHPRSPQLHSRLTRGSVAAPAQRLRRATVQAAHAFLEHAHDLGEHAGAEAQGGLGRLSAPACRLGKNTNMALTSTAGVREPTCSSSSEFKSMTAITLSICLPHFIAADAPRRAEATRTPRGAPFSGNPPRAKIELVGASGFEPPTPTPPVWCANQAAPRSERGDAGLGPGRPGVILGRVARTDNVIACGSRGRVGASAP